MRIGIFDSGVGGITVLKALQSRFPAHSYLYFGDTAHVPYGSKSPAQIRTLCSQASARMQEHGIDALIIACNTASSLALPEFREILAPIPILDVVEAGVNAVTHALDSRPGAVLILGTRATVRSRIYSTRLREKRATLDVFEQECPLLVPLIEEGWTEHAALSLTIEEYVAPYRNLEPGLALLACTHYPWIIESFRKKLPGWTLIDSAHAMAEIAGEHLGLLHSSPPDIHPPVEWYFSDPDALSSRMLREISGAPSVF